MMHTAESYASEWATLTGRSESEVYVPVALRPFMLEVGARVRDGSVTGRVVAIGVDGWLRIDWTDGDIEAVHPDSFDENGVLR